MYFNSSSRDGRRKSQRQGTRDESRVAECGLLSQILMIDRLKLDFFIWSWDRNSESPKDLIQEEITWSENPFLCASDLKILRIQRSNAWNIHGIPYATDDSAALCFCVLLCFYVLMILCLWATSGSRASWPFSPFIHLFIYPSIYSSIHPSIHPFINYKLHCTALASNASQCFQTL